MPDNLFENLPAMSSPEEVIGTLLAGGPFRLERIISTEQATSPGQWLRSSQDEWVVLLSGGASLLLEDESEPMHMRPGDFVHLPAGLKHRVESTDSEQPTVWLALHYTANE